MSDKYLHRHTNWVQKEREISRRKKQRKLLVKTNSQKFFQTLPKFS
jgi:hypothetical protein